MKKFDKIVEALLRNDWPDIGDKLELNDGTKVEVVNYNHDSTGTDYRVEFPNGKYEWIKRIDIKKRLRK